MVNIVAFDLDGTLLNDSKKVGLKDYNTLIKIGERGIIRIAATGRNLYSLQKVIPPDFPMDYAVFSSGAGIFNWKTKEITQSWLISNTDIQNVMDTIKPYKLNFTIHLPIPNNHHILLYDKHILSEDLQNYVSFYKQFASSIDLENLPDYATQLIVLLNHHSNLFDQFSNNLPNLKTILATSPIDNSSMWMEVFNKCVSKANGVKWIVNHLKINNPMIFAIGNDYNDIDLLNYCNHAFVVENAPVFLKNKFSTTLSNNEDALTSALNELSINNY